MIHLKSCEGKKNILKNEVRNCYTVSWMPKNIYICQPLTKNLLIKIIIRSTLGCFNS